MDNVQQQKVKTFVDHIFFCVCDIVFFVVSFDFRLTCTYAVATHYELIGFLGQLVMYTRSSKMQWTIWESQRDTNTKLGSLTGGS